MRLVACLITLSFLSACPPQVDIGDQGSGPITVNSEGGIFFREGVTLDIPKGALSEEAQITVVVLDSSIPEVPERKRISLGYRIFPTSLVFRQPIKIMVPFQEERLPRGVDVDTFDVRRQGGSDAYLQLPGASTNTQLKVVVAQTDRLGLFWATSPADAPVSKLELLPKDALLRVGDTQSFSAEVRDPAGNKVEVPSSWSVVPARAAKIDESGRLTALAPGHVTVTVTAGKLSTTSSVRIQGSTVGPRTFQHDNPFPTGNDLYGGVILGNSEFFVGGNATVLEHNSSNEWSRRASSPGINFRAAAGPSAANVVIVGVAINQAGALLVIDGTNTPQLMTFDQVEPVAVWFDGTYGMAVGNGNDVIVRRNGTWQREFSPSFETLLSVVGDGSGSFVTVGSRGSIYQFDPTTSTWNSLFQSQLSVLLTQAMLVNGQGSEAWAVGGSKLWHFENNQWAAINFPPSSPMLQETTAMGLIDNKIVIAGRSSFAGEVLVFDLPQFIVAPNSSSLWTRFSLPLPQIPRAVIGAGPKGFIVGDVGTVWKYTSGTWSELSKGFYGSVVDVAVVGTTVLAAVNNRSVGSVLVRRGPNQWEPLGDPSQLTGTIFSLTATAETNVVAGFSGKVMRYDGVSWQAINVNGSTLPSILDVRFCGNTLYAVGANGVLLRGNVNSLNLVNTNTNATLTSIDCRDIAEVWVAGEGLLLRRADMSRFQPIVSTEVAHAGWLGVWSPGTNEAFAFGAANYGVYWNSATLAEIPNPANVQANTHSGIWGSSIDNLYVVSHALLPAPFGYAARFDGANWTLIDSGSHYRPNAISGDSATNIWVATEKGGILYGVSP